MGKHNGTFAFADAVEYAVDSEYGRHSKDYRAGAKAHHAREQLAEPDGRMGRLARMGKWLGQKILATASFGREAQINTAVLKFRLSTYIWEIQQQHKYWEEWKRSNEGATTEFADLLHKIPNVRNND